MPPKRRRVKKVKRINRRIYKDGKREYLEIKPGVDGETYRTDEAFKGSRRAAGEFAQAAISSKQLRQPFVHLMENIPQKDLHNRLSKKIAQMIRAEKQASENKIILNNLPWRELRGFEFNLKKSTYLLLAASYSVNADKSSGNITIQITGFKPSPHVLALDQAEFVRIIAAAATINFDNKKTDTDFTASDYFPVTESDPRDFSLSLNLPGPVVYPLFVTLGVVCAQKSNRGMDNLANKRLQAMELVHVHNEPIPQKPPTPKKAPRKPKGRK